MTRYAQNEINEYTLYHTQSALADITPAIVCLSFGEMVILITSAQHFEAGKPSAISCEWLYESLNNRCNSTGGSCLKRIQRRLA